MSLHDKYQQLVNEYNELSQEHESLIGRYEDLEKNYTSLILDHTSLFLNYASLSRTLELIGVNLNNVDELQKFREVMIARTYLIYDYETGRWEWYNWHWLPITWYFYERTRIIHEPMLLEDRVVHYSEMLVREYVNHELIIKIASLLWNESGGDPEKFVNYVLELVHQLPYNETEYAKSPVETFIEGTGDCDNVAILAATLIENKGLDAVLIYGFACSGDGKCGGHAMIGVSLPAPPDDLFRYGRESYWYVDYNGKRYYIAECTPLGNVGNFDNPELVGFFVGDNPWASFKIEYIIDV